jgi:hypothetical protein
MSKKIRTLCLLFAITVVSINAIMAEPIDSTVWVLLKGRTSPINISYLADTARHWRTPSYECGVGDVGNRWTFPLICGMKLTAFKEEMSSYDNWTAGKDTKESLEILEDVFAGYGCALGGNYDEHWQPYQDETAAYSAKKSIIKKLSDPAIREGIWLFIEPVLRHQIKSMNTRYRGVVVNTLEDVCSYFGTGYDVQKAKAWYLKDKSNHRFAYQDYRGVEYHPSRKITAMIERLMFKWEVCDIGKVQDWLQKLSKWLHTLLGGEYAAAKAYWGK